MEPLLHSFPFKTVLSLAPLIAFWEALSEYPSSVWYETAGRVLERIAAAPALREPIEDASLLEQHAETLAFMMGAVFPISNWEDVNGAAFMPFHSRSIFGTPGYRRLERQVKPALKAKMERGEDIFLLGKTVIAYHAILERHYGVDVDLDYPLILPIEDPGTGLTRYYKILHDGRFVDIKLNGDPIPVSKEMLRRLQAEPNNLELWKQTLPPERFEFHGFTVIEAIDVTDQAVLSMLKDDLLQRDAMTSLVRIERLQARLREYLRRPELDLGIISFTYTDSGDIEHASSIGRSLLLKENIAPSCPHKDQSSYFEAVKNMAPIVVDDLQTCTFCTGYEGRLIEQGWRNLLLAPLLDGGRLIGLLELASPNPSDLNPLNASKLKDVLPLFSTALRRTLDEMGDRMEAVIKEYYTAIHPVVEWKFRRAALRFMQQQAADEAPQLESIVFQNVYPLYGLSDIRNSSEERNKAIWEDLLEQMGLALNVIIEASRVRPLPILDELGFRLSRQVESIHAGLNSEHEIGILDFLQHDIEALFDQLERFGPSVKERIDTYRAALDSQLGILYKKRKAYEDSVAVINETIGSYLDAKQVYAQNMFPHYFEKYKTDGVDYNIYIGSSLVENLSFDLLYLRNLRLWQFMTMCELVWELEKKQPSLRIPLNLTHLILIQNTPLTIRFRMEEKKFDVDGAYNIRYEIIKKRIDKARIKATGERLTQPGRIAVVYSHAREVMEYRSYIEYLQAAGYLTAQVEDVELEDLQGMYGLRALRVTVTPEPPESDVEVRQAEALEALPELVPETV